MYSKSINSLLIAALLCGIALGGVWEVTSEFTADTFDKSALSSWKLVNFTDAQVSTCGSSQLVGGYKVSSWASMSKTFPISVTPTSLQVSFDLYLIDKWTTGWESDKRKDTFQLLVNGVKQAVLASNYKEGLHSTSSNICGEATADRQTHFGLTFPFTATSLDLVLKGSFDDSTHPWWGIRNLKIYANYGTTDDGTVVVSELADEESFGNKNWSTSVKGTALMKCGDNQVYGGQPNTGAGATFTRVISDLGSHSFVTIKLKSYWIDSMDINDSVIFYLDDKIIHEQGKNSNFAKEDICGQNSRLDGVQDMVFLVAHTSPTATFKILVNTDQSSADESFAFRDFTLSTSKPCPVIYSEANGQGQQQEVCGDIMNLKEYGWTLPIKGIYLPNNQQVTIFKKAQFGGKKLVLDKTNLDLAGKEYAFLNKALNIKINENEIHLRHH